MLVTNGALSSEYPIQKVSFADMSPDGKRESIDRSILNFLQTLEKRWESSNSSLKVLSIAKYEALTKLNSNLADVDKKLSTRSSRN